MNPTPHDPESPQPETPLAADLPARVSHPDPITGEPDAHPVGVGVGALSAGAAGAAAGGLVAGPIGLVIGAAIGAIAGGLVGKEVAESPEISPVSEEGAPLDEFDHTGVGATEEKRPLPGALAERTNPPSDAFFTGGSGEEPAGVATDALDDFDRPRSEVVRTVDDGTTPEERPLPTASSGLVTPDESSFFADSTTGESSVLTEHPYPAAHAVSPGDRFAEVDPSPSAGAETLTKGSTDPQDTVRTGAYFRYLDRATTGRQGDELGDWIEAEKDARQS